MLKWLCLSFLRRQSDAAKRSFARLPISAFQVFRFSAFSYIRGTIVRMCLPYSMERSTSSRMDSLTMM